jgi:aminocarboxymuconate-semialdehyde decarboxylase
MKIDIHTHFIAPFFVEQARRAQTPSGITVETRGEQEWLVHPQGLGYPLHADYWDMEAKLRRMDELGIDGSVLSPAPTLFQYSLDVDAALEFCQRTNEASAEASRASNGRLYGIASLPMQDPEAAAEELRRAVHDLGLKGAIIGTTVNRIPLDEPRFEPFLACAEELGVPVVLHPFYLDARREEYAAYYMTNLIGYMTETYVAAARLVLSGCLDRHAKLAIVLVHAGGFLPYQIGRLDHGFRVRPETRANIDAPPSSYLRRFYFDTISHAGLPLKFLVDLVRADRVLLGTDLPFDMADTNFIEHLRALPGDAESIEAITSKNAILLFGLAYGGQRG